MATETLTAVTPTAGTLGEPGKIIPTPEAAPKALTTTDIEKLLFKGLEGTETVDPEKAGQEQTPAAAETTADQPGEGEEAEAGEERTQWPESAQKRVDKLTAQRAEAREAAAALQAEKDELERKLAEAEAKEPGEAAPAVAGDPLSFLQTPKALSEYVTAAKARLRDIEDHFDEALDEPGRERLQRFAEANGAFDKESGEFDAGKLKQLRRYAQDALQEFVPARMEFLKQEAQASQAAEQAFPWLKDRKSAEYGLYQGVLTAMPDIRKLPHWKAAAAVYVRGLQAVQAESKAKPNGGKVTTPAKTPVSKLPGASQTLPQRPAENGDAIQLLRTKATASRDPKDYERLLHAQLTQLETAA